MKSRKQNYITRNNCKALFKGNWNPKLNVAPYFMTPLKFSPMTGEKVDGFIQNFSQQ